MSTFDIHLILPCAALVIIMPLSCARIFSNSALLENRACLSTLHGALRQNDVVAFLLVFKLKKVKTFLFLESLGYSRRDIGVTLSVSTVVGK